MCKKIYRESETISVVMKDLNIDQKLKEKILESLLKPRHSDLLSISFNKREIEEARKTLVRIFLNRPVLPDSLVSLIDKSLEIGVRNSIDIVFFYHQNGSSRIKNIDKLSASLIANSYNRVIEKLRSNLVDTNRFNFIKVVLFNDCQVNTYAIGNYILISTGLLEKVKEFKKTNIKRTKIKSKKQTAKSRNLDRQKSIYSLVLLVFVIAHEISYISKKHNVQTYQALLINHLLDENYENLMRLFNKVTYQKIDNVEALSEHSEISIRANIKVLMFLWSLRK